MRFGIHKCGWFVVIALAIGPPVGSTPAWATSNVTYNFNEDNGVQAGWFTSVDGTAPLWGWNLDQSSTGGGWQAFSGTNSANSASYLTSPCFVINTNTSQQYVNFVVQHRYNFPLVDGTANQLGQIQYRLDTTGTGWGAWSGIPTQYFVKPNGNPDPGSYLPNYGPPLFSPLIDSSGTMAVQAWSDTTLGFASGNHQPSEFTLQFTDFGLQNGYEIQFRFAMATELALTGTDTLVWEVNKVQIDGVYECPEPGTLALGAIGGMGCLLVARRRRRRALGSRIFVGSKAMTILVAVAVACALAAAPARAQNSWDFLVSDGNWTPSISGVVSGSHRWMWTGTTAVPPTGGTSPHWHVRSQGMTGGSQSAALLTSPLISGLSGTVPAQTARISIAHDFLFVMGTNGLPITTGQLQYRLNGSGTWIGLPLSAFSTGSTTDIDPIFGPSPLTPYVDQADFVRPDYLTPSGTTVLKYAAPDSMAFMGESPGWPTAYVPTQVLLDANSGVPLQGITSLQLRFANLNIGSNCKNNEGWNVRFVQVDFDNSFIPPVPEPGALALGATGLAGLTVAWAGRRRHQRPSRPSDKP